MSLRTPNLARRLSVAYNSCRRESAKGWGYAGRWFCRRFYYLIIHRHLVPLPRCSPADRQRPLTVVVPAADKDATVLPYCLRAVKEMVRHPIETILVVAPESSEIRRIAAAEGCQFVHEKEVLPRPVAELKCRGWLLQQMIKFNAAFYVPDTDYLVLDADTVFLRPQVFFRGGKSVLKYSNQYELLYNRSLELAFGHPRRFPASFVCHHMLFGSAVVKQILHLLEERFGRPWHEIVLHEMDRGHPISFSEYELYGNHVVSKPGWRRQFVLQHWAGLDRHTEDLPHLPDIRAKAAGRLNSVSFHHHTQ